MTLHFKAHAHIHTDKQHFEIKQASMTVQEKEPLSAKRLQSDWKMVVTEAFKKKSKSL